MKHNKNIISRIIFFIIIYIVYANLFWLFDRTRIGSFYLMFIIMGLGYYLFGYLDFESRKMEMKDVVYSAVINLLLGSIYYMFTKSKKEFVIFFIMIIASGIVKYILTSIIRNHQNVLVAGEGNIVSEVKESILKTDEYTYVGSCFGKKMVNLKKIIEERKVEIIIITDDNLLFEYKDILLDIKLKGIKIQTYWHFNEEVEGKIDVTKIDEKWLLYSTGFSILHNSLQRRVKRLFDLVIAIIIFIPAIPIMTITVIMLKLIALFNKKERGPLLFSQMRVGVGNKPFKMYKLRSMITKEHWEAVGFDPNKESWTTVGDPRITKLGNFLRKTRLDELPQLLNIFRGDMSFVGPRPESVTYVEQLEKKLPFYRLRHSVIPGLTGWAQVMYPYGATVEDALRKLEFDLYYIKYQNLAMDIGIFFKTVKTVIFGKGR